LVSKPPAALTLCLTYKETFNKIEVIVSSSTRFYGKASEITTPTVFICPYRRFQELSEVFQNKGRA
jgi:hypothetical protein